ncbi:MAG: hypothetical protein ACE5E8_10130 [Acidimicrobiia bacterium]
MAARAKAKPLASLDEVVAATDPPAVLVLDHWQDARNVGAAVRSAVAAGVPSVVVAGRRAAPLQAGAFRSLPGWRVASPDQVARYLSIVGFPPDVRGTPVDSWIGDVVVDLGALTEFLAAADT